MKKSLLTCLLLINCFFLFAQENDDTPSYNNEWGLNITGFANQFLSFNDNDADQGPYLFTYKHIGKRTAFRMGAGLFLGHINFSGETNEAPLKTEGVDIALRLGWEKQHEIGRRWLFTAGGDWPIGYKNLSSNSESNFGTIKIKSKEWSVGFGPVLGIHFRFTPRVSIGTEGTIYLRYFNSKDSTDFGGIGGGDVEDKSEGVTLEMRPPLALYFAFRI